MKKIPLFHKRKVFSIHIQGKNNIILCVKGITVTVTVYLEKDEFSSGHFCSGHYKK